MRNVFWLFAAVYLGVVVYVAETGHIALEFAVLGWVLAGIGWAGTAKFSAHCNRVQEKWGRRLRSGIATPENLVGDVIGGR